MSKVTASSSHCAHGSHRLSVFRANADSTGAHQSERTPATTWEEYLEQYSSYSDEYQRWVWRYYEWREQYRQWLYSYHMTAAQEAANAL